MGEWLRESQKTWNVGATIWDIRASAMGRPLSSIFGLRKREAIDSFPFSLPSLLDERRQLFVTSFDETVDGA